MNVSENSKGFTLIELMIAIGIIAIIAAVAVPNIIGWLPNYRLKSAARDLVSNFQKAKLEAAKRNESVVINFNPGAFQPGGQIGSYQIFVDNGVGGGVANNGTRDGTEPILVQTTTMPRNVSLYLANFSGTTTAGYTSRGLPLNNFGGRVQIQNNNSRFYRATLSSAGHVRLRMSTDGINWN